MSEPLDLDAIMAEHHGTLGEACYGDNYDCPYLWPCPTYRLAAELTRQAQKVIDFVAEMSEAMALDAARIVAENDRLRAAEQRVRALCEAVIDHQGDTGFPPVVSAHGVLAALDGGQP